MGKGKHRGGGEDTRGGKAKAQKAASAAERNQRSAAVERATEDAEWSKGSNSKKAARDAEKKIKAAATRAKKQAKAEAEREDEKMTAKKSKKPKGKASQSGKLTRFQREAAAKKREDDAIELKRIENLKNGGSVTQQDYYLQPNVNKQRGQGDLLEADSLDGALSVLDLASGGGGGGASGLDKHPEKRMKAAMIAFREIQMPLLRAENPNLKKTQLDERIWKLWQKSSDNPMLQRKNQFFGGEVGGLGV